MDFLADWLLLIIGIALVGVLVTVGLLTSARRRKVGPPAAGTDVLARPALDTTDTPAPVEAPVLD